MSDRTTLVSLLRERASRQPDRIAYTFLANGETPEDTLTYRQLDGKARAIASHLQSGISSGDRALLIYPQGLEFIAAFFGCLYAGVVAIPTPAPEASNLKRSLPRLRSIIEDSKAATILTTSSLQSQLISRFAELETNQHIPWDATDTIAEKLSEKWREPVINTDTIAYLQYTSGSTSTPKGVILTHKNLICHLADLQQASGYDHNSITVTWMPYFHDYGLVEGLLQPLYNGTPCYLMSAFAFIKKPFFWLQAISRYKATHSQAPNFAYDYCVQRITPEQRDKLDLSSWQAAGNGAEPINPEVMERFCETFVSCGFRFDAFAPGYGLAEATLAVTITRNNQTPVFCNVSAEALTKNRIIENRDGKKLAGSGRLLPNTQVEIVHPETLTRCAADEVGEIWVASRGVAQGYWQRPDVSKETFQAYLAASKEGPFLRTGDLGFIKDGELFVTGRLKDLIIIRGENYYPQDIEWIVEKSHPALRPGYLAAFSVEIDGTEQLVIAQEVERIAVKPLNSQEVIAAIRKAVAEELKLPVYAVVLLKRGSIPKTSSGKIKRHSCRAGFIEGSLDSIANWTLKTAIAEEYAVPQSEYEFRLMQIWKKVLGLKDIGIQDNFFEWGGNSLKAAEVLAQVETKFGQNLPLSALLENPTIAQFVRCLSQPEWADDERSLVAIKPQGKKRPFFYVHPRSGSILLAANLGRYIDADRPFYGLQSVGLNGKQQPYNKIEDMAAHYIREIQTVQPKGPYLLGSRCIGGVIALEMAQQLLESGEKVLLLAIVETPRTGIVDEVLAQQIQKNMSKMRQLSQRQANNFQAVMNANDEAGKHYKPKFYPGQIAYFAAENTIHNPTSGFGWANLAGGGLEIVQVPGDHMSVTEEPHVGVFAQKLSNCLDEAERRGVSSRMQEVREDLERSRLKLQQFKANLSK